MNYPGQEPLPEYVYIDALGTYVRLYGSPDEVDPSEYSTSVHYKVAIVESALVADVGEEVVVGEGGDVYSEVSTPASGPGGVRWTKFLKWARSIPVDDQSLIRMAILNKTLRSGAWKVFWRGAIVVSGIYVALAVVDKVWSPISDGLDLDGDGEIDTTRQCTSGLFGAKTCCYTNMDTGEHWCDDAPDPIGNILMVVAVIGAVGIGGYVLVNLWRSKAVKP